MQGARLLLDLGLPLDGDPEDVTRHPVIERLDGNGDLLGLVLSHGHIDHWGLAHLAGPQLPVALGAATHRILQAAAPFVPRPYLPARPVEFESGQPLTFGPFRVTPHLVDHSAYDAYALEIEAAGTRIFYSGDFRAHGRKAALFERLLERPPRNIDVLLMEGSTLGRLTAQQAFPSETDMENRFVDLFGQIPGLALVAASAQNIDRMVSLYRACKRTGRTLIIDLYTAEILRATGNANIPQSSWPQIAVYIPHYQRVQIKRAECFDLITPHHPHRIYPEQLAALAPKAAVVFRPAMLPDFDRAACLAGAGAIWSQWDGYLKQPRGIALTQVLAARGIPLSQAHTSGHASIPDLQRLAAAIAPRMLVPIHTFEPHRFPDLFGPAVALKEDGVWWEAPQA